MKHLFLLFLTLMPTLIYSQKDILKNTKDSCSCDYSNNVFSITEEPAEFVSGHASMIKFLQDNIHRTEETEIMGIVVVQFIIDTHGYLCKSKILKGIRGCTSCSKEALRVVSLMPKWIPGKMNGRAVNCEYNLPVQFK